MRPVILLLCVPAIVMAAPKKPSFIPPTPAAVVTYPDPVPQASKQISGVFALPYPPFQLTEVLERAIMTSIHTLPADLEMLLRDEYREIYKDRRALYLWVKETQHPSCVQRGVPRMTNDAYYDLNVTKAWSANCEALMKAVDAWYQSSS
jgi:hypothetical protein